MRGSLETANYAHETSVCESFTSDRMFFCCFFFFEVMERIRSSSPTGHVLPIHIYGVIL